MIEITQNELHLIYGGGCDGSFAYDAGRALRYAFFYLGNGGAVAGADYAASSGFACK